MKNYSIVVFSKVILIGSVILAERPIYAQPGGAAAGGGGVPDPNLAALSSKLDEVKIDVLKLRTLVTAPAAAQDLHEIGADLASLATPLHMLSKDFADATKRNADIAVFHGQNRFHANITGLTVGVPDLTVNMMLVGYNFKQPLAEIDLLKDDIKGLNQFPNNTSELSKHVDALYWALQRVAANLPSVGEARIPSPLSGGTNDAWGKIMFWTGARLENPYSISISNKVGTLKSGNTKTDGFIGIEANLRYIFRTGKYEDEYWLGKPENHKVGDVNFYWPFASLVPDIDFNVDYVFTGTTSSSNYSASTIAQGADISLYTTVGAPVMRYKPTGFLDTNSMKIQITLPEIAGGMTTDKSTLVVHPNLFLGGGFQMAAPTAGFFWMGRLGYAMIDEPRIKGSTVPIDALGAPEFQWKGALTLGSTFMYKVTDSLSVKLAADAYSTHVGSWSVTAAVSIDPTKFFQSLK